MNTVKLNSKSRFSVRFVFIPKGAENESEETQRVAVNRTTFLVRLMKNLYL
jgi:hypothetical protein